MEIFHLMGLEFFLLLLPDMHAGSAQLLAPPDFLSFAAQFPAIPFITSRDALLSFLKLVQGLLSCMHNPQRLFPMRQAVTKRHEGMNDTTRRIRQDNVNFGQELNNTMAPQWPRWHRANEVTHNDDERRDSDTGCSMKTLSYVLIKPMHLRKSHYTFPLFPLAKDVITRPGRI